MDLDDAALAELFSYIRSNFGNSAGPVAIDDISQARDTVRAMNEARRPTEQK